MLGRRIRRNPRAKYRNIIWRYEASYDIQELPPLLAGEPKENMMLDRWEALNAIDKEKTLYIPETQMDWTLTYRNHRIAYGFEKNILFTKLTSQEYYGLVILRPKLLDPVLAIAFLGG